MRIPWTAKRAIDEVLCRVVSEKSINYDYKEKADWFCGAHTEKKRFKEGLSTWNDQREEIKRKTKIEVHGWNKRGETMQQQNRGGRAEAR